MKIGRLSSKVRLVLILVGIGGIVAVEIAMVVRRFNDARLAQARQTSRQRELESFRSVTPAPTDETASLIRGEVTQARDEWREVCAVLLGSPFFFGAESGDRGIDRRAEVFFDLAQFVDEIRALADADGVRLKPNECFGFSTHAKASPEPDSLECVLRQRKAMAQILTLLFDARPASLDGIRRERPRIEAGSQRGPAGASLPARSHAASPGEGGDFFSLDAHLSIRKTGVLSALAFRIVFTGRTSALRSFLNGLSRSPVAWFVRNVEVEPAAMAGGRAKGEIEPVVKESQSQFTVTVEIVEPSDSSDPSAGAELSS